MSIKDKSNGKRFKDGYSVMGQYINEIKDIKLLTGNEEKILSRRIMLGNMEARDFLVKSNLKLVVKIARHYINNQTSFIDLIQEGNIGLIKAAEKFDHRKGCRFSTYAGWWIRHSILRYLMQCIRGIKLPFRKEKLMRKLERMRSAFESEKLFDLKLLARELDVKEAEIEFLLNIAQPIISMDIEYEDSNYCLKDMINEKSIFEPYSITESNVLKEETERLLNSLYDMEREILKYRYGMINGKYYTLEKIGRFFGVSPETVRQIETKALNKLKRSNSSLKSFLYA